MTKVPSLDPATKRLAVEVEDHPLDYGTFEGTIPEGEYGGGTVQLWDRGTWEPKGDKPEADLAKGALKFDLKGERMQGGWALIRLRADKARPGRKTRNNWLLIKERDEAAQPGEPDTLLAADTSVTDRTHAGRDRRQQTVEGLAFVARARRRRRRRPRKKRAAAETETRRCRREDQPSRTRRCGQAITKLDLARYYEMAAERMLPQIAGRPISMVRAPDGISRRAIFPAPCSRRRGRARPLKARGEKNPFHAIDSVEGLVALAQVGVLEIHPVGMQEERSRDARAPRLRPRSR